MDIMKLGSKLLMQKLTGGSASSGVAQSAMSALLGGGDGGSNMASLVGGLKKAGMAQVAESWLGDGANDEISTDQVRNMFGNQKIQQMASQLGSDEDSVLAGLKDALPQMVDKSSSGGTLLDSIGDLGGIASAAKKFL